MSWPVFYWLYAALAVGAAGLCLALPSSGLAGRKMRMAGEILGAAALAALAVYLARWIGPAFAGRTFVVIFSLLAVAAAVRVVTHPRPVYCALYFVIVVLSVTGLCILAAAEFLAVALVIVYAGAILVTYIFVIMLAQQSGTAAYDAHARQPLAAVALSFVLLAAITQATVTPHDPLLQAPRVPGGDQAASETPASLAPSAKRGDESASPERKRGGELASPERKRGGEVASATSATEPVPPKVIDPAAVNGTEGNVRTVGRTLLTTYVIPLELAGVLLLVAIVGAIAIAQKRIEASALTPHERKEQRESAEDLHRAGREAAPF